MFTKIRKTDQMLTKINPRLIDSTNPAKADRVLLNFIVLN